MLFSTKKTIYFFTISVLVVLAFAGISAWKSSGRKNCESKFSSSNIPKSFLIPEYEKELSSPELIESDGLGNLVVGIPEKGKIIALVNPKNSRPKKIVFIEGLNKPMAMANYCYFAPIDGEEEKVESCALFIAEQDKISALNYNKKDWNHFVASSGDPRDFKYASSYDAELLLEIPPTLQGLVKSIIFTPVHFEYEELHGTTGKLTIRFDADCVDCKEKTSVIEADIDLMRGPKAEDMVVDVDGE